MPIVVIKRQACLLIVTFYSCIGLSSLNSKGPRIYSIMNTILDRYRPMYNKDYNQPISQPLPPTFCPAVQEVLEVKNIICGLHKLPIEVIDAIIDFAEYWPRTVARLQHRLVASGVSADEHGLNPHSNTCALRSLPLGYCADESNLVLPVEDYLGAQCIARDTKPSEVIHTSTLDLLAQWTQLSMPRTKHPCRKITFTIHSKDQGWGGNQLHRGTYFSSYTWFDVGLERLQAVDRSSGTPEVPSPEGFSEKFHLSSSASNYFEDDRVQLCCDIYTIDPPATEDPTSRSKLIFDHPFLPPPTRLQSNVLAEEKIKQHVITWSYDDFIDPESPEGEALDNNGRGRASGSGEFIRQLKVGDIITVWARARFPGWVNHVAGLQIEVYWAV